eukprot:Pgem_evm1s5381
MVPEALKLKLKEKQSDDEQVQLAGRELPFKNDHPQRLDEGTRPVHWRHRPQSYLVRTNNWDRFPNGR